jgi:hypothetical protein
MSISPTRRLRRHSRSITDRPGIDVNSPIVPPPLPPGRIMKSSIRPSDPNAPVMNQFSETVKRSASYLLKTIGTTKPELRPALNRAFATFIRSFNRWMAVAGSNSQRKLNEPPPSLSHLEHTLSESTELLAALRGEVRIWARGDADISETVARINPVLFEEEEEEAEVESGIKLAELIDEIAAQRQKRRMSLRELEEVCDQIFTQFQSEMTIDFLAQDRVCDSLR